MKFLIKLRNLIAPYIWQILLNLLILITTTILSLVVPRIIQEIIDDGISRGEVFYIIRSALILLAIGLLSAFLNLSLRYRSERVASFIGYDLRNRMYDHIQNLHFGFHDHSQTGQLISRCIEDVRSIQNFIGSSIIEIVHLVVMGTGVITILIATHPVLAIISLLPLIPMILMTADFGNRATRLFYAIDTALGDLSSRLQENVTGIQVVRAFAREQYEIQRFNQSNKKYFQSRIKIIGEWSKVMPTTNLLITMGTILILLIGGSMVLKGEMTVGEIVAFNAYLLMLAGPVQQLTWLVNAAGEASAGAQRVLEILETEPEIKTPESPITLPTLTGQVEFRNVCLRYQGEICSALEDINLVVEPNQVIALIGQTGSGKTSLVNLIPRFYDASEGAILVDGQDVRSVDLPSLRRQIGIVLQTSLLFSDSIRENIAYGRPDATDEEIIAAAKAAQAHEFITGFTNGYETIVGERGVTLSGGQRQRVAIARALLLNPRILILDDSTSSVDTQTEKLIQEALDKLMEGRTTFVIAHRLATVRRADLILVMENGRIVQRGRHDDLLNEGGLYKEIHDLQLSQNKLSADEMEEMRAAIAQKTERVRSADHSLA